jgi:hypothetical protein
VSPITHKCSPIGDLSPNMAILTHSTQLDTGTMVDNLKRSKIKKKLMIKLNQLILKIKKLLIKFTL